MSSPISGRHPLEGDECFQNEYTFRKADGGIFSGLLSASPLKSEKYAGSIVLVIRDLTDIEMMRRQVINAEKLASLGKVVEGVAHEIRNSLTSLGGFSRRLSKSVGPELCREGLRRLHHRGRQEARGHDPGHRGICELHQDPSGLTSP
ncbi:MAG: hypothetical protein MZV70_73095 [Desulfobacterales bacterium]|nr:hypothetical protein [Desulfobacterales bacterium]